MLCALLACVALWSPLSPVDAGVATHPPPPSVALAWMAEPPAAVVLAAVDTPEALDSDTTDLAGDLPELLLLSLLPVAPTARSGPQVWHPLTSLPHPFPERPQRPPRLITRQA